MRISQKSRAVTRAQGDELGAHVSAAGGVDRAPERAAELSSRVLQLFTKQPARWAEPRLDEACVLRFRAERERHRVRLAAAHDSYLINLATADPVLFRRSLDAFRGELARCAALGIELLVSHPGNATDGDTAAALDRNAAAIELALSESPDGPRVLLETTAGSGRALGSSFEHLAALIERIAPAVRPRVGVCMDTCHVWAAGYDLRGDYDGVMRAFEETVGLDRLALFHLNDSLAERGSRRDRHVHIGRGTLGDEPFRRLLLDERFRDVPKLLETPKDSDALRADRRNLRRLRGFRTARAVDRRATQQKS